MPNQEVVIIDYGMGNLWSVASAIKFLGFVPKVTSDLTEISRSKLLILPGVGSFRRAMSEIQKTSIDKAINEALTNATARILGICLGMQLLGKSSTEDSQKDSPTDGLNMLKNEIKKISSSASAQVKIPHIGFKTVKPDSEMKLFDGIPSDAHFYFVHSFCMQKIDDNSKYATMTHGQEFVAAIESGQIFGTQFHPEKSQKFGLQLLANYLNV